MTKQDKTKLRQSLMVGLTVKEKALHIGTVSLI